MYKFITLFLVIVILFVLLKKNRDYFSDSSGSSSHIALSDNYSINSVYNQSQWDITQKTFKYLNKDISMFNLNKDKYLNLYPVPRLKFQSFNSCPNLYHLFHSLRRLDSAGNLVKGEGSDAITFRNECEKIFYNSSSFIRIEHPIIEIESEEVTNKRQNMIFSASDSLDINYNLKDLTPSESYAPGYSCNFENEIKQINFNVESDFTMEDIYKFVDYSYTQLCFGMIYIEHMKLIGNHYRVLPSPVEKGSFFILPERIRHQVAKEGKYYTRAKCNSSGLNIIVLFGEHLPKKFDYIYPNSPSNCNPNLPNIDDFFNE